jgi:glycerol-3-phosphate O-acyltransferase/dihydroxyacetone phosphate acyltransferase
VVELNRRLVKGYTQHKDDPRIMHVKHTVNEYNRQLRLLGIRDHQVEYARFSIIKVIFTLIYRLGKLIVLAVFTLPGLILFAPVFIAAKVISIRKSREALAASTVKIQGRDVMATWKLLVALAFAPILYAFYTILFTYLTYHNRLFGLVPASVPLWAVVFLLDVVFPATTFAALRFGEIGMDIFKSLRPLVLSLNPTGGNTLVRLREQRQKVSTEVTELINTFGPEMFPDFDATRIVADPFAAASGSSPTSATFRTGAATSTSPAASPTQHHHHHQHINNPHSSTNADVDPTAPDASFPRSDSFSNLSSIGVFATRPPSRSRSRSSSAGGLAGSSGFPVKGFSTLASGDDGKSMDFDEVSKKIRGAMRERGLKRRKGSEELSLRSTSTSGTGLGSSWELAGGRDEDGSGVQTPATQGSDEGIAAEGKKAM